MHRLRPLLLLALLAGCPTPEPVAPAPPEADDPAFEAGIDRTWSLVSNPLTQGFDQVGWSVQAPEDIEAVFVWLDGILLAEVEGGPSFEGSVDVSAAGPGEHELLFATEGAETAFARRPFLRSHPLYVLVSVDWDSPDSSDDQLAWQDGLHADHPELRLTHFVGPYTWTAPALTDERKALLTAWLKGVRDDHDDEIGLHVHPWCMFVETTSVPCRTEPSYVYEGGDDSGYTVLSSAYTVDEYTELLLTADAIFQEQGFDKPTSFRAGGWIADEGVLRALVNAGYIADTSANNWQLMEEWEDRQNNVLWEWNQEHWSEIDSTSQPYYPSVTDASQPGTPSLPILEVPDNGILADYVEAEEMIAVLDANWDGGPLDEPRVFSIGYHGRTAGPGYTFRPRVEGALEHVDGHLAADDAGPLIYATLSEMPLVWPAGS